MKFSHLFVRDLEPGDLVYVHKRDLKEENWVRHFFLEPGAQSLPKTWPRPQRGKPNFWPAGIVLDVEKPDLFFHVKPPNVRLEIFAFARQKPVSFGVSWNCKMNVMR